MSSGMNAEKAKELASKRNYKWAVGNLKMAYGISYKKAKTPTINGKAGFG